MATHFGHNIAGASCDYISQFHTLRVSLALKKGIALERWSNGLSVMLEKTFGVRLVSKLRAILLMEADFNATNKEVYGVRMLDNARWYKLIPDKNLVNKTGLPRMAVLQKRCSTTSLAKRALRRLLLWLMRPTALTG